MHVLIPASKGRSTNCSAQAPLPLSPRHHPPKKQSGAVNPSAPVATFPWIFPLDATVALSTLWPPAPKAAPPGTLRAPGGPAGMRGSPARGVSGALLGEAEASAALLPDLLVRILPAKGCGGCSGLWVSVLSARGSCWVCEVAC